MGIMEQRLQEDDCKAGYLLDGFPRTIPQAEALKKLLNKMGEYQYEIQIFKSKRIHNPL
jgi:adenylate kinase